MGIAKTVGVFALLLATLSGSASNGAEPSTITTITLRSMCENCAQKMTTTLRQNPDVASVRTDVKSRAVTIVPKKGKQLSPKMIWETVEKSGEQPVRLAGPLGTFDSKPRR